MSVCRAAFGAEAEEFAAWLESSAPVRVRLARAGAAVALVEQGEVVWSKGYGYADRSSRRPVTPQTLFQAASVSKSLSALGVMILVEEGKVSLDTPVESYLTRWRLPASEFDHDRVTVARLLSHTAGFSVHGYPGYPPSRALPSLEESLSRGVRVKDRPGMGFDYSGGGFTVLQLMVEEVSGRDFSEYMGRSVLGPLGMERSTFDYRDIDDRDVATPYGIMGRKLRRREFTALAAAGLYTSADDLARFVVALMDGGTNRIRVRGLVSPETIDIMFTPREEAGGIYGLGFFTTTLENGDEMVYHGGDNLGYHCVFALTPEKGAGMVFLSNSDGLVWLQKEVLEKWRKLAAK